MDNIRKPIHSFHHHRHYTDPKYSEHRVIRVSSDNVNIIADHREPAEVLSQLDDTIE